MVDSTKDIIRPWDAFAAPTERLPLSEASGRIAASTIRQYPPGIPEIIPGMQYSLETIKSLELAHAEGGEIIGIDMESNKTVEVLKTGPARQNNINIQTYDAQSLSQEAATEMADYFRASFCAAPYFHFAFHESDPLQSLPHTLDFDAYTVSVALSDPVKRKTCQETLRGAAFQRALKSAPPASLDSIILPEGFHLWTDRARCRVLIQDRLTDPGYVTLVRHKESQKLLGLLHARMGTIERLFYSEEWSDPLIFSEYKNDNSRDDPVRFFQKMDFHFGLKPSDMMMTISAQVLDPDIQGGQIFYDMMRSMALKIKPEHAALPLASEIPPHGTAHTLNTTLNHRLVFGVLKNEHPLVFCSQMSQALFLITSDKAHWNHALRKAVRDKREYRTQYYISQSTDHQAVAVKQNGELGLGVFAAKDIPAGTRIAVFTGERYQSDTALGLPDIMRDHAIQIGPKEFVFGYKGLAHRLCHSCDPNCGIRHLTEIFAVRDVRSGEELTWDYRCSENSNWIMETCLCGADRCTGAVANFDSLSPDMKSEYLSKSMVSDWIASGQKLTQN